MKVCVLGDARSIHVKRLARGLVDLGVEAHVVTHKPDEIPGVSVERFGVPGPSFTNLRRWNGRRLDYLRRLLRGFDVVSVQFLADWGLTPDLIDEGCLVATAWGSDITPPPGEGAAGDDLIESRRMLLRCAAGVTTWGLHFARAVADFAGLDGSSIEVLPLGVDLDLFDPQRFGASGEVTAKPGPPVVGFFKGFRPVYGPAVLVRAIPHVLRAVPEARFELVGDGVQLEECQELARSLGVSDAITWLPRCTHGVIPQLLSRWSVSVIPSICEAFGVAALESSAMGVPVVASDVGGLRDTVVAGGTGLLVPVGDHVALSQALIEILTDAPMRARLALGGRAMVAERFEFKRTIGRWFEYFDGACARRRVMV